MEKEKNTRLIQVREKLGFTQKGMAQMLDVSQSYLSDIENGRRAVSNKFIDKLSKKLDISSDWMQTGKGEIITAKKGNIEYPEIVPHNVPFIGGTLISDLPAYERKRIIFDKKFKSYLKNNKDIEQLNNAVTELFGADYILRMVSEKYFNFILQFADNETTNFDDVLENYYKRLEDLKPYKKAFISLAEAMQRFYKEMHKAGDEYFEFAANS